PELLVAHRAELLQHLDHAQELLPVRRAQRLELPPADTQPLGRGLQLAPLAVAAGGGPPGAAMTFDRGQRGLRTLRALAPDQFGHREPPELGGEVAERGPVGSPALGPATITRHVERRRGPEDPLDHAALHAHRGAVRQERVDEHAMTANRVDPEHHRERRRASAADEHQAAGFRLRDRALPAASRSPAERPAANLDLIAGAPGAPDALEIAAWRSVASQRFHRALERLDVVLDLANALEVLVLPER